MLAPQTAITRAKSPEAFRTISEVAAELDVPQHVLRFWESRFAQVKPIKRAGGRRYYRPEDVDLLRGIRALLYSDGFTIRGVQKILRDRGLRHVAQLGRTTCLGGEIDDESPANVETDSAFVHRTRAASVETSEASRRARAMKAARDHEHGAPSRRLAEEERVRLELLLAELLQLKSRLSVARARGA